MSEAIPLARPVLGEPEERAVVEVLRSGQLSLGPRLPEFERAFATLLGARHASAVSSGTTGLHLALRAVGVSDGDEVVTSPLSFVASANAILYERARPVFADIDPVTLNLDPKAAEAAVGERTRALLPVHLFGYPADLPELERIAERHDLAIVEDACEALGARHRDGPAVGARGHPAVFGFYANKQLTTGEGGIITLAERGHEGAHRLRAKPGPGARHGLARPRPPGLQLPPLGARRARSGSCSSERLPEMLAARAAAAERYRQALAGIEDLELPCADADGDRRGWFVFVVQLPRAL